jgi:hypothetical protein
LAEIRREFERLGRSGLSAEELTARAEELKDQVADVLATELVPVRDDDDDGRDGDGNDSGSEGGDHGDEDGDRPRRQGLRRPWWLELRRRPGWLWIRHGKRPRALDA